MDPKEACYWYNYDNKPVLIQLRPGCEYVGVTYPNEPLVQQNAEGQVVGVVTTPILKGLLRVKPNGKDGILLILQTRDPNPANDALVDIVLHPDDALYVSQIEKKLVVQP